MRLLRIAVRNLNSLYGEHEVDIERGLGGAPLFLIMGPTGSGKSTLMDAVSLALFGQTPRLQHSASAARPDEDARNVMSHGTGEAQAQVEVQKLENAKAVRYRATWTCRRARGKPDGNLQAPKRCLERSEDGGQSWTTLVDEDREKFFGPEFAAFLEGLTVTDFKRSMLLAQGEFSAFLKADEAERASILERLTDTSSYKSLGERAAHRKREAEDEKRKAEAALGSVQLLTPEQEAEVRAENERATQEAAASKERLDSVAAVLAWRERMGELDGSLEKLAAEAAAIDGLWSGQQKAFAALEEHNRCAPAAEALSALDAASEAHRKRAEALPDLAAREVELEGEARTAEERQGVLAAALEARTRELAEAAPQLASARALKGELQSGRSELQRAEAALSARQEAAEGERGALAALEKESGAAQEALELAQQRLKTCEHARPLIEALAGLKAQATTLESGQSALASRRKLAADEQQKLSADRQQLQERRKSADALATEVERLAALEREAADALMGALGGADDEARCREALTSKERSADLRLRKLEDVERLLGEKEERSVALERLRAEVKEAQGRSEAATGALQALEQQTGALEVSVKERTSQLEDQRLLQSYARGRGDLQPGKECPLCGGTEHPFLNDPRYAELDQRVAARCAELEAANRRDEEALKGLQSTHRQQLEQKASAEGEIETLTRQGKAERASFDRCEKALAEALTQAGCAADALSSAREEAVAEQAECRELLARLDSALASSRAAASDVQKARHELEQIRTICQERSAQLEDATGRAQALSEELQVEEARLAGGERELAELFTGFGINASGGVSEALADAQQKVQTLRDADAAVASATSALSVAKLAASTAAAKCAEIQAQLAPAQKDVEMRRAACAELEARLGALLAGEDPDQVEKRLTGAKQQAADAVKEAAEKLKALQIALATAKTLRTECERQLLELETARGEAQTRLETALRSLGIPDQRALRAVLLTAEDRTRISNLRAELERKREQAATLLDAQRKAREQHQARKPPVPEDLPEDAAALSILRAETEARHREQQTAAVLSAEKLRGQAQLRDRLGVLQKQYEEKCQAFDVWARLHHLIGVGDGEGFKRFAQTLNLGELIGRANAHLERLAPRYKLVGARSPKGEARLAFAVQDAFHAGEARPVNTLSGGESFLVSLALALALASYRSVKMPIETLLLDEGFGTLDPETLQVAMAALEALNATGTQVGIISHVEALKERIPARVVVSQTGSGRSQVRVELDAGGVAAA